MILEVVDEHESPFAIAAYGVPQRRTVTWIDVVLAVLQGDRHSCEFRPERLDELVQGAQSLEGFPYLAEFSEGCLEIVGAFRSLPLIEESVHAFRIGSAVEHVVSEEIASRAEFDVGHRVDGAIRQRETVVVRVEHAAAHLAAGVGTAVRIVWRVEVVARPLAVQSAIAVFVGGGMLHRPFGADAVVEQPWSVRVSSPQRHHVVRNRRLPAGAGEHRRVDAFLNRDAAQPFQVTGSVVAGRHPFPAGACGHLPRGRRSHVFVVDLCCDDRPAVLEVQAAQLFGDMRVEVADLVKEAGVEGTNLVRLAVQPVGKAAVAYFAVAERSKPHNRVQAMSCAQFHESAHVPVAGEIPFSLAFFVVVPEHVGGHDVDARRSHLREFRIPSIGGKP